MKKEYVGINIQYPISELIVSGVKTVETRTYPIPKKYVGRDMVLIETPGKKGKFKARMVALIRFGDSFEYKSKAAFYRDCKSHCVTAGSLWAWQDSVPKWGWPIEIIRIFKKPLSLQKRSGIKFSTGIYL